MSGLYIRPKVISVHKFKFAGLRVGRSGGCIANVRAEKCRLGPGDLKLYSCEFVVNYNDLPAFKSPRQGMCF